MPADKEYEVPSVRRDKGGEETDNDDHERRRGGEKEREKKPSSKRVKVDDHDDGRTDFGLDPGVIRGY